MKRYIGDSVYADFDGYCIILTTENGMGPSNIIALEPEVVSCLLIFISDVEENKRKSIKEEVCDCSLCLRRLEKEKKHEY